MQWTLPFHKRNGYGNQEGRRRGAWSPTANERIWGKDFRGEKKWGEDTINWHLNSRQLEFSFSLLSKLNQCFMLNSTNLPVCPFHFKITHTTRWQGGKSKYSSMQEDKNTRRKWPRRTGGRNCFKYQGHWKWLSANQSCHFCAILCPQLTTWKITVKQTTNILMVYVWMSPAHASIKTKTKTKKKKGKTEVPFHIRHRTKLIPFTYSRRKWVFSWLLFVSFFPYYMSID